MSKSKIKDAFGPKDRPTPKQAKAAAAKVTGKLINDSEPPKRGRPKATHGLKRTTMMMDKDLIRWAHIEASTRGVMLYEIYNEALKEYRDKHQGK